MRDVMYDIPSNPKIAKCIITKETVAKNEAPEIIIDENKVKEPIKIKRREKKQTRNQETA
jgi:ATP-dependent Clp protease ATP-binding subunit ClpX